MSDEKNKNNVSVIDALKEGLKDIDAQSWPGVFMFLALIAVESTANIIASLPDFGWIVAILVGLLFGVFMACWHIITERTKNSVKQQSTAEWLVYITAGAAIFLLVVNLIRLSSGGDVDWSIAINSLYPTAKDVGGWDIAAVGIVGISFTAHLIGYLTWHDADNYRKSKRDHSGKMNEINDQELKAKRSLRVAEVRLLALDAELTKTNALSEQYKHLPASALKSIIEEARKEIREAFEKKHKVDLDGDGHIGAPLTTQYASATELQELEHTPKGKGQK